MRTVELVKGIKSSVLGFGCAPILGAVDGTSARRAIDCAIDVGITHFDIARSYGYGEAEHFVGKVLGGKRQQIVLASKFGIMANWKAKLFIPAKPLVRLAIKTLKHNNGTGAPAVKAPASKAAVNSLHNRIPITGEQMRLSLEKSLKALRTDYLDYLFVHEPIEMVRDIDELLGVAKKLKNEGKIRGIGLAYMLADQPWHQSYLDEFDVLQFNNAPNTIEYHKAAADRRLKPNIIFSPLRGDATISPAEKFSSLTESFPESVILCSMFNERHLVQNAALPAFS